MFTVCLSIGLSVFLPLCMILCLKVGLIVCLYVSNSLSTVRSYCLCRSVCCLFPFCLFNNLFVCLPDTLSTGRYYCLCLAVRSFDFMIVCRCVCVSFCLSNFSFVCLSDFPSSVWSFCLCSIVHLTSWFSVYKSSCLSFCQFVLWLFFSHSTLLKHFSMTISLNCPKSILIPNLNPKTSKRNIFNYLHSHWVEHSIQCHEQ